MELVAVTDGLAAVLAPITGLRILPYMSDNIVPPAALISFPEIDFDQTLGDLDVWMLPLWVFVAKVSDRMARKEVALYMSRTGSKSIKKTIEASKTLGGSCDTVAVRTARPQVATVGLNEYLAVLFTLEVFG